MIPLQKLEKALFKKEHDFEFKVLKYPILYAPKPGEVGAAAAIDESWQLLYKSAKNGGISVFDALVCIRKSGHAMNVFINEVLEKEDYKEAKTLKYSEKNMPVTYSDEVLYCHLILSEKIYSDDDLQKLKAVDSDDAN